MSIASISSRQPRRPRGPERWARRRPGSKSACRGHTASGAHHTRGDAMHPATNPVTRLGLQISNFTFPDVPDAELFAHVSAIAGAAEESGFDSVWVMDHFYQIAVNGPREHPMLEAYTVLAGIAARTSRVS